MGRERKYQKKIEEKEKKLNRRKEDKGKWNKERGRTILPISLVEAMRDARSQQTQEKKWKKGGDKEGRQKKGRRDIFLVVRVRAGVIFSSFSRKRWARNC